MINQIKKILGEYPSVEWVIKEEKTTSSELFFVFRSLEMNRSKDVIHYKVTVYQEHDGYKGSASFEVYPTMNEKETRAAISDGVYATQFVKNKPYKIAEIDTLKGSLPVTNMDAMDLDKIATLMAEDVFAEDKYTDGFLNATEVFVNRIETTVYNSNGVKYTKKNTVGEVEYISTWKGEKEEVEIYDFISISSYDSKYIREKVANSLQIAKLRAQATPLPTFKEVKVVFRANETAEMMIYFTSKTNVSSIYQKFSDWKVGSLTNEKDDGGDKLTITINPFREGSPKASPFDSEGYVNEIVCIIDNNVVKNLWGPAIYGQYLGYKTRVNNVSIEVDGGTLNDVGKEPYLEIVSMSGIQVDDITGSFGGEIRLAVYHDGGKQIPYYGGSISGMINEQMPKWHFTKEKVQERHYYGPKYLVLEKMHVLGKE